MKVACFSDFHEDYPISAFRRIEENKNIDLVVIAGDVAETNMRLFKDFIEVVDMFLKRPQVVFIAGNHDKVLYNWRPTKRYLPKNMHYLEDEELIIDGFKIYGSPWTPPYGNMWFMANETEIKKRWIAIPDDTDILITHGPPKHIKDGVRRWSTTPMEHVGCPHLLARVQEVKPLLHVFGHIHEGYGNLKKDGTWFVNASRKNEQYLSINEHITVEITKRN